VVSVISVLVFQVRVAVDDGVDEAMFDCYGREAVCASIEVRRRLR